MDIVLFLFGDAFIHHLIPAILAPETERKIVLLISYLLLIHYHHVKLGLAQFRSTRQYRSFRHKQSSRRNNDAFVLNCSCIALVQSNGLFSLFS